MDNGPELISQELADWAQRRNIKLKFIEKGKPYQNGFMERFNRSLREEVLDAYCFPQDTRGPSNGTCLDVHSEHHG
jgi:putative transposase